MLTIDHFLGPDGPVARRLEDYEPRPQQMEIAAAVAEGETLPLTIDWSGAGSLGRHKAIIELQYGKANIVTDSTFFYVVPWWAVAVFVGLSLLSVALVTRIISRAHTHHK